MVHLQNQIICKTTRYKQQKNKNKKNKNKNKNFPKLNLKLG